jgi:hypothetical protein
MSDPTSPPKPAAKKRKHATAAAAVPDEDGARSPKKPKKEKKEKEKMAKAKSGAEGGRKKKKTQRAGDEAHEFAVVRAALRLSLPPVFAGDARAGAEQLLDSMLMRCAFPRSLASVPPRGVMKV